jgi:hypothetical protein
MAPNPSSDFGQGVFLKSGQFAGRSEHNTAPVHARITVITRRIFRLR